MNHFRRSRRATQARASKGRSIGTALTGRMAGGINGWVTDDPEGDWPMVSKHVAAQFDSCRRHMVECTDRPVPRPVDPEKLRTREQSRGPLDSIAYGTPDDVPSGAPA